MNAARHPIRTLLLLTFVIAAAATAKAQTTSPGTPDPAIPPTVLPAPAHHPKPKPPAPLTTNTSLIVIDPAHGAADNGATFPPENGQALVEKDITLALANRLADSLKAKGFTVLLTRTNSTDDVPADARVELANRSRPLACILLHAANGGHGVHLYTSALTAPTFVDPNVIVPWDSAQVAALSQSLRLTNDLATALNGIRVPLVTGRSSIRPIDSLTCPAVAVEVAPISANGDINTPVSDPNYQARVADAVATALVFWRGHAESVSAAQAQAAAAAKTPATLPPTPKPLPKPKPKPAVPAPTTPDSPAPAPHQPAPIIRATPPPPAPVTPPNS